MPSNLAARRNATQPAPIQTSTTARTAQGGNLHIYPPIKLEPSKGGELLGTSEFRSLDSTMRPESSLKPTFSRPNLVEPVGNSSLVVSKSHSDTSTTQPPALSDVKSFSSTDTIMSKISTRPITQAGPFRPADVQEQRPELRTARSFKNLRSSKKTDELPHSQLRAHWYPPPLFQAYPQAIKHASLEAPSSSHPYGSAETRTSSGLGDQSKSLQAGTTKSHKLLGRIKSRSRLRDDREKSREAESSTDGSWSRKVFVLVTSGYLIQYSGDGAFDRTAEKILKLGPDSAAFASDALAGKHWVLEVIQSVKTDDFSVRASNKGFMSRFGVQSSTRRMTSKLLLVFSSPDEMESWMLAIRKEIGIEDKKELIPKIELPSLKRYSSIIRDSKIESGSLQIKLCLDSNTSSPTLFAPSLRDSDSTLVVSESSFRTRKPPQTSPTSQDISAHSGSLVTSFDDQVIIGPALKSPGFFERHQTPMVPEFPQQICKEDVVAVPAIPKIQHNTITRRMSLQSISSKSHSNKSELNNHNTARPLLMQSQSASELSHQFLISKRLQASSESDPSTPSTPSLQSFPEPPRKAAMSTGQEMDSIAESPPTTQQYQSSEKRSVNAVLPRNRVKVAKSSIQPAGFSQANQSPLSVNGGQKRTSVFTQPQPIVANPGTYPDSYGGTWLDPASGRTSVGITPPASPGLPRSRSPSNLLSNETDRGSEMESSSVPLVSTTINSQPSSRTTLQYSDTHPSMSSPNTSASPTAQENMLKRPASLQVRSDRAPFLSASGGMSTHANVDLGKQPITAKKHFVGPLRSKGNERVSSAAVNLRLPPQKPPPNTPLPLLPALPTTTA